MQLQSRISCLFFATATLLNAPNAYPAEKAAAEGLFQQLDQNGDERLAANEIVAEHARLFSRLLRTADNDGDGQLSAAEFEQGLKPRRLDKPLADKKGGEFPGANALLLLLARMDANGDRTIVADEVPEELEGFFNQVQSRIGGEEDGRISKREIVRAAPRLSQLALRFTKQRDIDVEVEMALLPENQWAALEQMDGPNRPGEMLSDPGQAEEMFQRLDADGDGQVMAEEVPPLFADRFEQMLQHADQDGNGHLGKKEFLSFFRRLAELEKNRPPATEVEKQIGQVLKQFDRNGDEVLSREETPRRMKGRFDRLDANGNATLDRHELRRVVELLNRMRKPEPSSKSKKSRARKKERNS